MNSYTQLNNIIEELQSSGKEVKVTKLPTRKPRKTNLYANRIKGGSTRVRCNGGSRGTNVMTKNSALSDVK